MSVDNVPVSATQASPRDPSQTAPAFSIDDLNPDTKYEVPIKQLINSPRTLEACRRQGIDLRDLEPVSE